MKQREQPRVQQSLPDLQCLLTISAVQSSTLRALPAGQHVKLTSVSTAKLHASLHEACNTSWMQFGICRCPDLSFQLSDAPADSSEVWRLKAPLRCRQWQCVRLLQWHACCCLRQPWGLTAA